MQKRINNFLVSTERQYSGNVYSCGCSNTVPVEDAKSLGWERKLMTGCLVWCCKSCKKYF